MLSFNEPALSAEPGQLYHIATLLIGPMQLNSVYYVVSWSFYNGKQTVNSIDAAGILAAGVAIDVEKILARA